MSTPIRSLLVAALQHEALRLLGGIAEHLHVVRVTESVVFLEAELPLDLFDRLCLFDAASEDLEDHADNADAEEDDGE